MPPRQLPILNQAPVSSALRPDGKRSFIVPADVEGTFTRRRQLLFLLLIEIYVALPWISVGGRPAVFLDVEHRAFYLFGLVFNAQDFWMAFFLASGVGFALIALTAVYGRVWCGYACPQTVFLEGVFRRVERLIEAPRNARLRREAAPLTLSTIARKVVKHAAFLVLSFLVAHVFLSYFVSLPALFSMMRTRPLEHPQAFAWALSATLLMYFNYAWFREQLCLIVCPYGRLQSLLTDNDSLVIGYDARRGEPRTKGKKVASAGGDCVDCGRCVVVCPTGIDIRNGLQMECIGCAACVDACDAVMDKLDRPRGLIRYGSQNGLSGLATRLLRPRIYVYFVLGLVGLLVAGLSLRTREPFEANLLRLSSAPFVIDQDQVRNAVELHLVNKRAEPITFSITAGETQELRYVVSSPRTTLESLGARRIPIFVSAPNDGRKRTIKLRVDDGRRPREVEAPFVAP